MVGFRVDLLDTLCLGLPSIAVCAQAETQPYVSEPLLGIVCSFSVPRIP